MIDRQSLGEPAVQLVGRGTASREPVRLKCSFSLNQYSDGRILLFLDSLEQDPPHLFFDLVGKSISFEGESSEGYQVHAAPEDALAVATNGGQLIVVCGRLAAALPEVPPISYFEFRIVNYPVSGIRIDERVKWVDWVDVSAWSEGIPVDTPEGRVLLLADDRQRTNAECLKYTRGVRNTCSLLVKGTSTGAWETAEALVDRLCRLLALLSGTRVNWVLSTHHDSGGRGIGLHLRQAVVSEYVPPSPNLMANVALTEFTHFVDTALGRWEQADKEWGIETLIDAFADARSTGLFLETKGLRLCVCLEIVVDAHLNHQPYGGYLLAREVYESKRDQLTLGIDDLLQALFPQASPEARASMTSHWLGLNRVPFGKALNDLRGVLGLSRKDFNTYRVKQIRDCLVHSGHYLDGPDESLSNLGQFRLLEKSVRTVLMAILGYKEMRRGDQSGGQN